MTRAERRAIRAEAKLRVGIAFAAAGRITRTLAMRKKVARLLLCLSTREISRLGRY